MWGSLAYSYQSARGLFTGENEFPDKYHTISHQAVLRAGFRPAELVDLNLVLPMFHIRNRAEELENFTLFGQGDTLLLSDWHPWRGQDESPGDDFADGMFSLEGWKIRGGIKLPTGRPENDLDLSRGPASLQQLGTGTFDLVFGIGFSGSAQGFSIFARADAQVALHENRYGFRPAERVTTATGFSYTFIDRITPGLALSTLHLTKDTIDGDPHPDTGSHFWFLTPSLSIKIIDGLNVFASVRIPFIRRSKNPSTGDLFTIGISGYIRF